MYSRNRATPSAFMTSAGSTPTPFGRTWNWSATSRENAWTALHQPETREVDGIVIIHPNWWGQPRLLKTASSLSAACMFLKEKCSASL
jgi:hypothetical protein